MSEKIIMNRTTIKWVIWSVCTIAMVGCIVDLAFYDFIKMNDDCNLVLIIILGLSLGFTGIGMRQW